MTAMTKAVSFFALFCLIGCSAVKPVPGPQPATPPAAQAEPRLWIRVIDLPGWVQAADAQAGGFLLMNQAASAQVQISTFARDQGEPRDIVGWLMVKLAAQGVDIVELVAEPGARTARLTFSAGVNGQNINGLAAAKWSRVDGVGFLLIGLWPAAGEPLVLPDFERMFLSIDLYEQ